jgi:hypothetical protein
VGAGGRALALAASFGVLCGAAAPASKTDDVVSAQLVRFADNQLDGEFLAQRDALITACPYALGSYSFIALSGIRRIYRIAKPDDEQRASGVTASSELTVQVKRARYYWAAGKDWIVGSAAPTLHYYAERRDGRWSFRPDQHICARGEPQQKPLAAEVPK